MPDEYIDRVWAVMLLSPRHTFQVLTKRPARMLAYLTAPDLYERVLRAADGFRSERQKLMGVGISNPAMHPPRWIWLGVSVEGRRERHVSSSGTAARARACRVAPDPFHYDPREP